uniref:WGS project CBMI000000000 data, contig CS3069_c004610 n=1 Tax=Fusarium clavum TaxID=2594811 RepID=A0A090MIR7_9HYPO|nr:unnamed protein product [Fusarium clavum]CEG05981.1 unnamed protein product [Fusarium clavum]
MPLAGKESVQCPIIVKESPNSVQEALPNDPVFVPVVRSKFDAIQEGVGNAFNGFHASLLDGVNEVFQLHKDSGMGLTPPVEVGGSYSSRKCSGPDRVHTVIRVPTSQAGLEIPDLTQSMEDSFFDVEVVARQLDRGVAEFNEKR